MAENMMNKAHKATNEEYRNGFDRIFRKDKDKKEVANGCNHRNDRAD